MEQILKLNNERFWLFPIKYHEIYKLYKECVNMFWTPEEIDLYQDIKDFEKLTSNEKFYISNVLSFFAASDMIVMENLACNLLQEINIPESRLFLWNQIFMEWIHTETYNILLDTLIKGNESKKILFNGIENSKTIKQKKEFCMKYMDKNIWFSKRIIAYICVEGIFFCSSFCWIFYFKKRNLLSGLSFSNELISRDESQHVRHLILIYELLNNKLLYNEIIEIFNEAVKLECYFVRESLPVSLIGINADLMCNYVEFCADKILELLKLNKYYNSKNNFDFMDMISLEGKTNFFEKKVWEYQKSNNQIWQFSTNENF